MGKRWNIWLPGRLRAWLTRIKGSGFNTLISGYGRVARVASGDRQMHRCLTKAALSQPSWTYFTMWIAVWPYEVAPAEWQSRITDLRVLGMQFFSLSLLSLCTSDNTYCNFSLFPFSYFGGILDTQLPSSQVSFAFYMYFCILFAQDPWRGGPYWSN